MKSIFFHLPFNSTKNKTISLWPRFAIVGCWSKSRKMSCGPLRAFLGLQLSWRAGCFARWQWAAVHETVRLINPLVSRVLGFNSPIIYCKQQSCWKDAECRRFSAESWIGKRRNSEWFHWEETTKESQLPALMRDILWSQVSLQRKTSIWLWDQ